MSLFLVILFVLIPLSLAFLYNFFCEKDQSSKLICSLEYNPVSRSIVLDKKYVVVKFNEGSTNHLFFEYLFLNPNRKISKDEICSKLGDEFMGERCFNHFLATTFTKDFRESFFVISGDTIKLSPSGYFKTLLRLF